MSTYAETKQYRKKPVVISAVQFDPNVKPWPEGVVANPDHSPTGYSMTTLENIAQTFEVTPGDWIITGVKGERYACKPDIFAMTYESV